MKSALITSVNVNSIPAAYIMSHSTFNFGWSPYHSKVILSVVLHGFPDKTVLLKIEFIYINIGEESSCSNNTSHNTLTIVTLHGGNTFTCSDVNDAINIQTLAIQLQGPNFVGFMFETTACTKEVDFC